MVQRGDRRPFRAEVKHLPPPSAIDKIPPPHDLTAELTFLAAMTDEHAGRVADFEWLPPASFFSEQNRVWWTAILSLAGAGIGIDVTTVRSWFRENGKLGLFANEDIVSMISSVVAVSHPDAYAETISKLAKLRTLSSVAEHVKARVHVDHANASDVFAEAERMVGEVVLTAPGRGLRRIGVDEICAARPREPHYLCKGLRLAPGRVVLIGGAPDSGKTVLVQSLASSFASGKDALGVFGVRRGKVVHLNWDQPLDDTENRYEKLWRGLGITAADVRGYIEIIDDPPITFDEDSAFAELRAICRGADCVILDALTGALGDVDENSPAVGRVLRRIGKISEQTSCVIIVIHHSGKPPATFKGKKLERDELFDFRGSGSITGATGAAFMQRVIKKGEIYGVKMVRTPTFAKRALDPFALRFTDLVDDDGRDLDALRVTYVDPDELAAISKTKKDTPTDSNDGFEQLVTRAVELMKAHPASSGSALHARAGKVTERRFFAAIHDAHRRGLASFEKGPNRSQLWRAT